MVVGLAKLASASQAYGSINNFDCVNDTGKECHGFEIELDYGHSTDISYTYDYNHYGTPKIREDATDPVHPRVFVRYESKKNPDGTWASYTAIPSGPISPTQGHQFTDPSVNFGGEHFGLGFSGTPSAVKYHWLVDDGTGTLIYGPDVYISTPSFTYNPPVGGAAPNVVAVVAPPPPIVQPPLQFGQATWVKEIKTVTHNPHKLSLKELVGDDPGMPQPWANGEAAEVEVEWSILQTEFAAVAGGKHGDLAGLPEDLPGGDEIITRRYEFSKYVGPYDAETGEAMADVVGPDGIHGQGIVTYADHFDAATGEWVTVTVDLSTVVVVGEFFGAQMAGFDIAPALGLIDHIQECDVNVAFPDRTVVIPGSGAFLSKVKSGTLPPGLSFDKTLGVLSGTPTAAGLFTFTIEASDTGGAVVTKTYSVRINGPVVPTHIIYCNAFPTTGGTVTPTAVYPEGTSLTIRATPNPTYVFLGWTEAGLLVSPYTSYKFNVDTEHRFVANFVQVYKITTASFPDTLSGSTRGAGNYNRGSTVTVTAAPRTGWIFKKWSENGLTRSGDATYTFTAKANTDLVATFTQTFNIRATATPASKGTVAGAGIYKTGTKVTLTATPSATGKFVNWMEGTKVVSTNPTLVFFASADRRFICNFAAK